MIYIMSDLHGCYKMYQAALEKINFSDEDTLYILGDVIDRGFNGIKILQDMSLRWNIIPILGNHEYMALQVLERLCVEINEDNYDSYLCEDDLIAYTSWMNNGGAPTVSAFLKLDKEERLAILDYLNEFLLYEQFIYHDHNYVLVHAGLSPYHPSKSLDDYQPSELLFKSNEESNFPFTLICGHTPSFCYGKEHENKIYQKNQRIVLDTGCIYGYKLAIYCLDTKEAIYIDYQKEDDHE